MGDYVASVVSGNSKLLKVSSYTKDGAVTLKAQKKTGKTKLTVTLAGGAVKTVNVTIQKGTVKTTKISGCTEENHLKEREETDPGTGSGTDHNPAESDLHHI